MKLDKANKRDKKLNKRKHGMQKSGRSVFTIQQVIINRAKLIKIPKPKEDK